jgi:uncharacterized protein YqhQ
MDKQKFDFAVGGQALIEGVMMRSKNFIAMAVRNPNGEIKIKDFPFKSFIEKHRWANIPFIRGVINMIEMLGVGMKAINFSANEFVGEEEKLEPTKWQAVKETTFFIFNMLFAFAFAILIFKFIPLFLTELINKFWPALKDHYMLYNAIDGIIKIIILVLYILAIMISKTIRRVFMYHGAEHKAVFTYEHQQELNPANAAKESRFHPRCGTSFIILVFVISIIVYTFIPRHPDFLIHLLRRLAVLPLIAGIAYEALKISARHMDKLWVRILVAPGLLLQRLTTLNPDESQLEVSIAALKRTLELEENAKNKN